MAISVGGKLKQLAGMVDTKDLKQWENGFLKNVLRATGEGQRTSMLTGDQLEKIDEIFAKHCGAQ